jgi:hypothetical protein
MAGDARTDIEPGAELRKRAISLSTGVLAKRSDSALSSFTDDKNVSQD